MIARPPSTKPARLLAAGLAALLLALAGCGSGSEQSAQGSAGTPVVGGDGQRTTDGSLDAASLTGVRGRLEAKGFDVQDGFPSGQATRAISVIDAPGVDISAFQDHDAARTAYVAARRLSSLKPGRVLVRLRGGDTRLYYADADRPLTRHERDVFLAVVAVGEGDG